MGPFNYSRVDLARRRRGLTKNALAEAADISTRSLLKYEREGQEPTPITLQRLADALSFPVEFFHGETLDEPPIDATSFRSLSRLTARQREQALTSGALALALSDWIEGEFDLPAPDVPEYEGVDPETAAEAVREAWGLGNQPIPNMVHLLELHGVRVFSLVEDCEAVDGFSFWRGSLPYVFLNTMKTVEHSRMDAAHELGHLVLHGHGGPRGRQAENEAYAFGAAFLMPANSVRARVTRGAGLNEVIKAKAHWKVATVNLARRAHRLGLLTDWQYRSTCIALSKRGRANEPNPLREPETSQVLAKVLRLLRDENNDKTVLVSDLGIPADELSKSVFGHMFRKVAGDGESAGARPSRSHLRAV